MATDHICKYLAEQNPKSFARWLLGNAPSSTHVLKIELSVEPIRADFVALLRPHTLAYSPKMEYLYPDIAY